MSGIGPGDLVVCVDAQPDRVDPLAYLLVVGRTYRVAVAGKRPPDGELSLGFRELLSDTPGKCWGFSARRFRKIDKADEQFTETVRACRPVRERQPA